MVEFLKKVSLVHVPTVYTKKLERSRRKLKNSGQKHIFSFFNTVSLPKFTCPMGKISVVNWRVFSVGVSDCLSSVVVGALMFVKCHSEGEIISQVS